MIAKVIVDVPARETDRPFDYLVPERWAPLVRPGVRVGVPFGPRVLQGFVLRVDETTDTDPSKLKSILSVLDAQPVVTDELLELAVWISQTYACPLITALTALLPSALKAKTETVYMLGELAPHAAEVGRAEALLRYVEQRGQVSEASLLRAFEDDLETVRTALERGWLVQKRFVKNRLGKKKQKYIRPSRSAGELREAAEAKEKRAPKQAELLRVLAELLEQGEEWPLAEILKDTGLSASVANAVAEQGYAVIEEREIVRDPYAHRRFAPSKPLALTDMQAAALAPIQRAIRSRRFEAFLLHGVTGSGKTEVYLQAMQACLEAGREAILLVPEISLTPQTVNAFKGRFGDEVAVMHSRLSQGERYDEWRKIAAKQAKIAIGARSAIFAPFTNIGLIIIDEEHESSYKQEESPKYHARDVALRRGREHGAAVVLGSATPSLESYWDAHRGVYSLLEMPERVGGRPLPSVSIVDMRQELKDGNRAMFSRELREGIEKRLQRGEQSVLLLNRRGYSTFVMCRACGYTVECPHCDITMIYHRTSRHSRCHYCGYTEKATETCPSCGSEHIRYFGAGTQRVEEELAKLFPGIRTIRMDVDTTSQKGSHEKLLSAFREGKADVLLGTQMVAKGLDFPQVTLVGVISADTVLRLPDFRAAEKTFQLLTQVAGRAGRHSLPGEVIIQTYTPEHYSIQYASKHDFHGFARRELLSRKELAYPPYCRLAVATLAHEDISKLIPASERFAAELKKQLFAKPSGRLEVFGPVPSPIPKLKDRYRFQLMVKYPKELNVAPALRAAGDALAAEVRRGKLSIQVDVDPQVMM